MKTKNKNRQPDSDVAQLPREQSEMYELAARVACDDQSARALIAIIYKLAYATDSAERDRLADSAVKGAYMMTSNISAALESFCREVDPLPGQTQNALRLVPSLAIEE